MKKERISVVVPCYNEEETLPLFYEEIKKIAEAMAELEFEILFVDDGSTDHTLPLCQQLCRQDDRIRYISFSRNFGKEAAMYAGLRKATGAYVVLMDADLQDPPSMLPEMFRLVKEEGYDSVATRRISRKGEPFIRSFFARQFYRIINRISSVEVVDGARDYRLMTRQFVDALLSLGEYNRFSKGLFSWVGYRTKWLAYENVNRVAGETKWSFWKLLLYSMEGLVAFTTAPLTLAVVIGILFCFLALIFVAFVILRTVLYGDPVKGWASTVCIVLFLGGLQLFCTGILGEYLAKTYLEVKKRPIYLTKQTNLPKASPEESSGTQSER